MGIMETAEKTALSVYKFGNKKADGGKELRNLLGGKGANLAEMSRIGIPVPPGFTITTEVCTQYTQMGRKAVIQRIDPEVREAITEIENTMGTVFGDNENPLLLSVRLPHSCSGWHLVQARRSSLRSPLLCRF